jgi:hypothetical protein
MSIATVRDAYLGSITGAIVDVAGGAAVDGDVSVMDIHRLALFCHFVGMAGLFGALAVEGVSVRFLCAGRVVRAEERLKEVLRAAVGARADEISTKLAESMRVLDRRRRTA